MWGGYVSDDFSTITQYGFAHLMIQEIRKCGGDSLWFNYFQLPQFELSNHGVGLPGMLGPVTTGSVGIVRRYITSVL